MLCEYGCNNKAKYTISNGKKCCSKSYQQCPAIKAKNKNGVQQAHSKGKYDDVYSNLPQETKDKMAWSRGKLIIPIEEVFVDGKEWGSELLRKYINHYELKDYKCEECGIIEWRNAVLTLELDHINGKRTDNRLENLRWLCPNCHSLTSTFRGYNKSLTGKAKVSDEELLTALKENVNIRQALQSVGLAAKGGNYERAKRLLTR